ncbi:hypothetical protein CM1200mP19_1630 [bacterium]|nr:MAG: hypothetical protein CM1200mP19_1630 [bacterium]
MEIEAVDVVPLSPEDAEHFGVVNFVGPDGLDDSPATDYLSVHLPLNDETHHIIEGRRLALLKPGACVINVARGELVDEEALLEFLQSGHLAGAGLDVFGEEPFRRIRPSWIYLTSRSCLTSLEAPMAQRGDELPLPPKTVIVSPPDSSRCTGSPNQNSGL